MADELVFYSGPMSRGRIVQWVLEEVGAPYRFEVVNLEAGEQKKPSFLAINPMGEVPAIAPRGAGVRKLRGHLVDARESCRAGTLHSRRRVQRGRCLRRLADRLQHDDEGVRLPPRIRGVLRSPPAAPGVPARYEEER